ncbi:MAG: ABC-2 transporter permease [Paenibacillus sp.]|uniref:ABC-2 transporter permease n=1 Tax=Paenibacillus sp. TaxID=58172 RepID=UPI003B76E35C
MMDNTIWKHVFTVIWLRFYGKYQWRDWARTWIGLLILIGFEFYLILHANLTGELLTARFIGLAVIASNGYMTLMMTGAQWKEQWMERFRELPVDGRTFWISWTVFCFIDYSLRRTIFFYLFPLFLFINGQVEWFQAGVWMATFAVFTWYGITAGSVMSTWGLQRQGLRCGLHGVIAVLMAAVVLWSSQWAIGACLLYIVWCWWHEFPLMLRHSVYRQGSKAKPEKNPLSVSFYKREWKRFLTSPMMLVNWMVFVAFVLFFTYQFLQSGFREAQILMIGSCFFLLLSSPIALLFSIEKKVRLLLLSLPLSRKRVFWSKYRFYIGLLMGGFLIILCFMSVVYSIRPGWKLTLECLLLLAVCGGIRLKADELRPNLSWVNEQKLWSGYGKYRSVVYCLPVLAVALLPSYWGLILVPLIGAVVYLTALRRKNGGFYDA